MEWIGDENAFDRAVMETPSLTAFARALRSVPPDHWSATEVRLRVKLGDVQLVPEAEDLVDGRDITAALGKVQEQLESAARSSSRRFGATLAAETARYLKDY
jgi:hypothetical protein